ncbi:squalene synthase HpnC [Granulicella sp. dw_53]|uniref:squalene synthase HpnC n=1 Tax=Granulicella sp. dw_53 TaxID=2719792 RepID=UPI001BD448B5|nr:squalene synthase HpnC [Granulicella sp. dw_53]
MRDSFENVPAEPQRVEERPTLEEARAWCRELTSSPSENFRVALFFLPKRLRTHFECLYAYRRVLADLVGETADPQAALRVLRSWQGMLDECYDAPERSMHPVFVALRETIVEFDLPRILFLDLVRGFQLDEVRPVCQTWEELLEYSHHSANSVGRLVLLLCGYREEELALLSDKFCTALQLANLWQDVVEDAERGRRYIPEESLVRFGVDEGQIEGRVFTLEFRAMMQELVTRTRAMLLEGGAISGRVDPELAVTLDLFRKGGEAILDEIVAQDYDVLRGRPVVTKVKKLSLLAGALMSKARMGFSR